MIPSIVMVARILVCKEIRTIKCAVWPDAHGQSLRDVIANSCNDAMMQIGAKMGTEQFLKAQTFQFRKPDGNRSSK